MEAVLSLLSAPGLSLKLVRPKALLDNCFRVMELLYCSCCKELRVDGAGGRRLGNCAGVSGRAGTLLGMLSDIQGGRLFLKLRWALHMGTRTM